MTEKKYLYWMAVSESEPVRFSELAHMMAKAMHPSDAELDHYGATLRIPRDGGHDSTLMADSVPA